MTTREVNFYERDPDEIAEREAIEAEGAGDDLPVTPPLRRLTAVETRMERDLFGAIEAFPGPAEARKGLCPSCLDSGFVYSVRDGVVGIMTEPGGRIPVRCSCPVAKEKLKKRLQSIAERNEKRSR